MATSRSTRHGQVRSTTQPTHDGGPRVRTTSRKMPNSNQNYVNLWHQNATNTTNPTDTLDTYSRAFPLPGSPFLTIATPTSPQHTAMITHACRARSASSGNAGALWEQDGACTRMFSVGVRVPRAALRARRAPRRRRACCWCHGGPRCSSPPRPLVLSAWAQPPADE